MSIGRIHGVTLSAGAACGPLHIPHFGAMTQGLISRENATSEEIGRFQREVSVLGAEIEESVAALQKRSLKSQAQILRAHLALLRDGEFHRQVQELVSSTRYSAEAAVRDVLGSMAEMLRASENAIFADRAQDVDDLAGRLLERLGGASSQELATELAGADQAVVGLTALLPSVVLKANALGASAFLIEQGTGLSHGTVLARAFGKPVVRVESLTELERYSGQAVLVDGDTGEVLVSPDEQELEEHQRGGVKAVKAASRQAPTVRLWVNITDPGQLERLEWSGVEGVGFYRTDGLFLREGAGFASEEEQLGIYGRVFELAGGRAVVVRTADLRSGEFGGDGSLAWEYLSGLSERFYQSHPEAFVTQVRAVLRAAAGNHRVRLIVPKIETLDQWRLVRGLVEEARGSLERQGQEFQKDFLHGLVVETLAAAWRFRQFLEAVDFVSVDTNNLVRYLFAVEQEEGKVEDMYQPEHPIVLKVLGRLAEEANAAGRWFCMSGAMAADPGLLGVLVGMGVEHLSVAIAAVEAVRERLRQLDQDECRDLAGACREAKTAEQVRKILGRPGAKGGGF